ncbi:GCN5-related N-acetyltransferase domain containing protein [Aphelenchoides fujianensis]|nr:GCN5-related N-acetyltransferase domain containing protein [Aphelenchoides fujianensis]
MSTEFTIRQATPEDAHFIAELIQELADFEKMPDGPQLTVENLADDLRREAVFVKLAFSGEKCAGMVLYYLAYSSWQGQYIHMEDLNVKPEFRRRGLARFLVKSLAKDAYENKMKRINWNVLDWNQGARDFYATLGAVDLSKEEGWLIYRLADDKIREVAES